MIHKLIPILFILGFSYQSISQGVEYQITVEKTDEEKEEFGNKLVDLAILNFPDHSIVEDNAVIAKHQVAIARYAWLDQIVISGNLNESAINPPDESVVTNVYYPRYNFGVRIPLGIFVRRPIESKIAVKEYNISLNNVEKMELEIERSVLTLYNNYLLYENIYIIKSEITEEAYAILKTIEEKFSNGEIGLIEYNNASRSYKLELEKSMLAKVTLGNAKLELEMWIGTKLEEVK